tara:strand:+ start:431 stop:1027 length:597 start_codon:yes stop_codon:yes gene_type:complete
MWNSEICLKKIYRAHLNSTLPFTYIQINKKKFSELFNYPSEAIANLETISTHLNQTYKIEELKKEILDLESYNSTKRQAIIKSILYLQNELKSFSEKEIKKLDDSSKEFLDMLKRVEITGMKVDVDSDSGDSVEESSFEEVNEDDTIEKIDKSIEELNEDDAVGKIDKSLDEFTIVERVKQENNTNASSSHDNNYFSL